MKKITKAVITAAGRGTRQYPASSAVQKEMFPMVDRDGLAKPIIQIIGEEAIEAGVEEICIVTQPGEEQQYRSYFRRMNEETLRAFWGKDWAILQGERLQDFGERLRFVSQDSPEGYGHAVYQARDFVGDDPFILMLGDHIYISPVHEERGNCAAQLVARYHEAGFSAMSAVQPTPASTLHLFGVIRDEQLDDRDGLYRATAIHEKPDADYTRKHLRTDDLPSDMFLGHFSMHVFGPAIFDALKYHIDQDIREKGEFQLTNAQEYMRANLLNHDGACTIAGQRFDTGIPYGMTESQLTLALAGRHRGEIVEAIARLLAEQLHSVAQR